MRLASLAEHFARGIPIPSGSASLYIHSVSVQACQAILVSRVNRGAQELEWGTGVEGYVAGAHSVAEDTT